MPRRLRSQRLALSMATMTIACTALLATVAAIRVPDAAQRNITWATQTADAIADGDSPGIVSSADVGAKSGSRGKAGVTSENTIRVSLSRQGQSSDLAVNVDAQPKRSKRAPKTTTTAIRSLGVKARALFARAVAAKTTTKAVKTTTASSKTTSKRPTTSGLLPSTTSRFSVGGTSSSNNNANATATATVATFTSTTAVAATENISTLNINKALTAAALVNQSSVAISSASFTSPAENLGAPSSGNPLAASAERNENVTTFSDRSFGATVSQGDLYSKHESSVLPTAVNIYSQVSTVAKATITSLSREALTAAATSPLRDPTAAANQADAIKAENATSTTAAAVGVQTLASLPASSASSTEDFPEKISSVAPSSATRVTAAAVTFNQSALLPSYALHTTSYGATATTTALTTASPSLDMSSSFNASASDRHLPASSSDGTSDEITALNASTAQPSIYKVSSQLVTQAAALTRWLNISSPPVEGVSGSNETFGGRTVEWRDVSTSSAASGSDAWPARRVTPWLCGLYISVWVLKSSQIQCRSALLL